MTRRIYTILGLLALVVVAAALTFGVSGGTPAKAETYPTTPDAYICPGTQAQQANGSYYASNLGGDVKDTFENLMPGMCNITPPYPRLVLVWATIPGHGVQAFVGDFIRFRWLTNDNGQSFIDDGSVYGFGQWFRKLNTSTTPSPAAVLNDIGAPADKQTANLVVGLCGSCVAP